jgi:hypothetical protein
MEFPNNTYMSFVVVPHHFSAIRVLNERVAPVDLTLKISIAPLENSSMSDQDVGLMAARGFQKLKVWLDIALQDAIIINYKSPMLDAFEEFTDNPILYVPREPDDYTLSAILHSKLSQIVKGHLLLDTIVLSSSDTFDIERYFRCKDGVYTGLPGIEYLGEEATHSVPWWARYGMETVDYAKNKVVNVEELLELLTLANEDLEEAASEIELKDAKKDETETEAEIVTVETWTKEEK